jgi:hypothetical protein
MAVLSPCAAVGTPSAVDAAEIGDAEIGDAEIGDARWRGRRVRVTTSCAPIRVF